MSDSHNTFKSFQAITGSTHVNETPFERVYHVLADEGWGPDAILVSFLEWYRCDETAKLTPLEVVMLFREPRVYITLVAQADRHMTTDPRDPGFIVYLIVTKRRDGSPNGPEKARYNQFFLCRENAEQVLDRMPDDVRDAYMVAAFVLTRLDATETSP